MAETVGDNGCCIQQCAVVEQDLQGDAIAKVKRLRCVHCAEW